MAKLRLYCSCESQLKADGIDQETKEKLLDEWDKQHTGPEHEQLTKLQYLYRFWGPE